MSEGNANFIGKDGFNWFVGQVENDGSGHFYLTLPRTLLAVQSMLQPELILY